ncbi:MAG TPA: hypothetical protein VGU63_03110 [Candidatus Acidoferrales bacterium]|nr:hypothetical protein [Candidatus Acidoferrales bacterium]
MKHAMSWANIAALLVLVPGISSAGFAALPQSSRQSSQSLAAAARKAQEKEKDAPKAKTVWTNDNIPDTPGGVSIVGQPPAAASSNEPAAASTAEAPSSADKAKLAVERAKASADLDDAKEQLRSAQTDLDIAQREYNLDAAQLYSTPDYSKNEQGQAKVDGEKAAIATKQQAVDAAQKKVGDIEKLLKSLGGEEKPVAPPAPAPAGPAPLKP